MNLLMKGAALAPPFSCTTKYSSDVYSPRPPDIRVRLLPTKPPVHFTTEQPGRDMMLQKRDEAIQSAEQQINEYRDAQASLEARKESMQPGIDLLDAITSESSVSDAHLRMFVNKVYLHEQDGKLRVEFVLNADFQTHLDLYDQNGELKDVCNDLGYYFSKTSASASA